MCGRRPSRKRALIREPGGVVQEAGDWVQVSRLANPLFNEVIVPMGLKDLWNSLPPAADGQFLQHVQHPELAQLLPVLYPGVFPNLANLTAARADLVAILLTGIPSGVVPGFQNYTGKTFADELRLNMAIPPTTASPSPLGIVGGDLAGFPNGRRVFDDVVTIEFRAIAGATVPLVNPSYKPDAAASLITDGLTQANTSFLSQFPYLGTPQGGYQTAPLGTAVRHDDERRRTVHGGARARGRVAAWRLTSAPGAERSSCTRASASAAARSRSVASVAVGIVSTRVCTNARRRRSRCSLRSSGAFRSASTSSGRTPRPRVRLSRSRMERSPRSS